ncbi:MAG: DUF5615 family PIN-like protein [Waterburya sp.]
MSKIRFYIDEDASRNSLIINLRNVGIDILTTFEAENLGLIDSEQLIWSTNHNRAIYTFNVQDYCRLHKIYMTEGTEHSGIIAVARQSYSVGEQLRGLQKLVLCMSSEEIRNQLIFLGAYI